MEYYIGKAPETSALSHYGILGMKWGVRRYQNKDGSYTKAGLERYYKSEDKYNAAKDKYKKAKQNKKVGNINSRELAEARREVKSAKKEMGREYDKLKMRSRADRGKELYRSGKSISNTRLSATLKNVGIAAAGTVASRIAYSMNTPYSEMAAKTIQIGSYAAQAAVIAKGAIDIRDMRAYIYR